MEPLGDAARQCLEWILAGMGIEGSIEVLVQDGQVKLNVFCGEDSSIVIGRKGQTLEALQVLVNRIVLRKFPGDIGETKVLIDVEGYRDRRRLNLLDMAHRSAEKVRDTGESVLLSPLNSYERFLVHSALKDEEDIVTKSRGEGLMKQICIQLRQDSDR